MPIETSSCGVCRGACRARRNVDAEFPESGVSRASAPEHARRDAGGCQPIPITAPKDWNQRMREPRSSRHGIFVDIAW